MNSPANPKPKSAGGDRRRRSPRARPSVRSPYQDQITNTRQARREIRATLMVHWAARKQAPDKNLLGPASHQGSSGLEAALKSRWNPRVCAPLTGPGSFPGPSGSFSPDEEIAPPMSDAPDFGALADRAGFLDIGPSEGFVERPPFDGVMEFPAWMNADEDDFCGGDFIEDPAALPRMDINENDGMDEEWLA